MTTRLIGIDCATRPEKTGLALGVMAGDRVRIEAVANPARAADQLDTLADWLNGHADTLIGLDAPLGWPWTLGSALHGHRAGTPIPDPANDLFRRETDRVVQQRLGKRPMDVGADRIARTAHAALALLGQLTDRTGHALPLAWSPAERPRPAVVEVYPGGTLTALGLAASGYKGAASERRRDLLNALTPLVTLPDAVAERAVANDHVLDAILCVVAGADFLAGRCPGPTDTGRAAAEGWIWVRAV